MSECDDDTELQRAFFKISKHHLPNVNYWESN